MRRSLVPALVVLLLTVGLAPGCSSILGDFSKGPGSGDASAEDSGGESDSSMVADSTTPVEASPGADSGHEGGGQEAGATDSGPSHDSGGMDGGDGGCGAGNELCSGTCVSLTDPAHCGSCGHNCNTLPNVTGTTTCSAGVCNVPPTSCATGYGHCTNNPDDGCETAITTPTNCGACGAVCGANTPLCNSNAGSYSCGTSCGGTTPTYCAATKVCTNLQTDPNNCNTCSNVCPGTTNGTAFCMGGTCGINCAVGYHLCGALCLSNSSTSSCGTSCSACGSVTNGTPGCNGTSCDIGSCNPGYANCNGIVADGCNVDTQTDPANCNGCNNVCNVPNATAACSNGTCAIGSCNANYEDCDHMASDGCEIDILTNSSNCGGCGNKCTGGQGCTNGICACGGGETLCNGTCTSTQSDNNNCGGCGQVCTGTVCASGLCTPVVLASGANVSAPYDITTDGTNVYWTNYVNPGSVGKVADSGGTSVLIATAQVFPQDIAYYSGKIYFTIENAGNGAKLMSVTTAGGSLTTIDSATNWAALGSGSNYADGIASDKGGNIYWASNGGGSYLILKYSVSGGSDTIDYNSPNGYLGGIAADSTGIVYTQPTLSRVIVPPNNAYDTGDSNPGRVTNANGVFYYVIQGTGGNGQIHSYADSTTSFNYVAMNLNHPAYIASDGVSVYWSDETDNAIYRTPVAGGPIFTLVKMTGVSALTVDSTYVYFVTTTEVLKVPK